MIKIVKYFFGVVLFIGSFESISQEGNIFQFLSFILLSFVLLPIIDYFGSFKNNKCSLYNNIFLIILSFIVPACFYGIVERYNQIFQYLGAIIFLIGWFYYIVNTIHFHKNNNYYDLLKSMETKKIERYEKKINKEKEYIQNRKNKKDKIDNQKLIKKEETKKQEDDLKRQKLLREHYLNDLVNSLSDCTLDDITILLGVLGQINKSGLDYDLGELIENTYSLLLDKHANGIYDLTDHDIEKMIKKFFSKEFNSFKINFLNVYIYGTSLLQTKKTHYFVSSGTYRRINNSLINRIIFEKEEESIYHLFVNFDLKRLSQNDFEIIVYSVIYSIFIAKLLIINRQLINFKENSDYKKMIVNMLKSNINEYTIIDAVEEYNSNDFNDLNEHYYLFYIVRLIKEKVIGSKYSQNYTVVNLYCKNNIKFNNNKNVFIQYLVDKNITDLGHLYSIYLKKVESDKFYKNLFLAKNYNEFVSKYIEIYNIKHKEVKKNRYLNSNFTDLKTNKEDFYILETGYEFESYLCRLFESFGYKVQHNGKTGDQGCDLLVKYSDTVYSIQAKFYTGVVTNTPVQEVIGSLKYYNAKYGVVITNSTYTKGAINLANANSVILIDGSELKKIIDLSLSFENKDILKCYLKNN